MSAPHASGLDGINVADTALSDVDGERGKLTIRGYPVEELVERAPTSPNNARWAGDNKTAASVICSRFRSNSEF